mmetsp:Transcript_10518/g.16045  ORF Transcript_10518/g.16045 Transcript_10518/m.16045 type:complete len:128 (+) Transcript_10518:193-576(+)
MITKMKDKPTPQQFVVICDLTEFTSSMLLIRNIRYMIGGLIYVAQSQYPERLRKAYMINAPFGFATVWAMITPFLEEKTASKMKFIKPQALLEDIDASVLTEEYGGTHKEYRCPMLTLEEEAKIPIE